MKIRTLPSNSGWHWLRDGLKLVVRYPLALALILFVYGLISTLPAMLIPNVGGFWPFLASPIFAFGLLSVFQTASKNQTPQLKQLFAGFYGDQTTTRRLIILGVINLLGCLSILALTNLFDGGKFMGLITGQTTVKELTPNDPNVRTAALIFMALLMVLQSFLWYAPAFVGWQRWSVGKSLFSSAVAVWRNKMAFVGFGICWLGIGFFAVFVSAVVFNIVGVLAGKAIASQIGVLLNIPVSIALLVTVNAAIWRSYESILTVPDAADAPPK
jgi:hypothetical protein